MADHDSGDGGKDQGPGAGTPDKVMAGKMPPWDIDQLPVAPPDRFELRRILGPGLLMVGMAIGGGEWLTGPALTAQYGGTLMWIATVSILLQCAYNLEVMRYTLYCGEPILVGFFRLAPGPRFWTVVYLIVDFGAIWPYLAANAAVPLLAAFIGHLPGKLPTTYLTVTQVVAETDLPISVVNEMAEHEERFGLLQEVVQDTGLPTELVHEMALHPERFGSTQRWRPYPSPMAGRLEGVSVDQIVRQTGLPRDVVEMVERAPELFGTPDEVMGETGLPAEIIQDMADHPNRYRITQQWKPVPQVVVDRWIGPEKQMLRWLGFGVFFGAFVPLIFGGKIYNTIEKAQGVVDATGAPIFWFLTLLCGFIVLGPAQIGTIDTFCRRWTDVIWSASRQVRHLGDDKVKYIYYSLMITYGIWGIIVLTLFPDPLLIVKLASVPLNFALGLSAIHTLFVNCVLLPEPLRPGWFMRLSMVVSALFFVGIAIIATTALLKELSGGQV